MLALFPAARPITNVFYFECIIHLDTHTHSFSRNSIISIIMSRIIWTQKYFFLFLPSFRGRAIPSACNPHVSDYIRAHSTDRKRERESERILFYYVHIRIIRTLPEIIIEYRLGEDTTWNTRCTVTSITNHRLFSLPSKGKWQRYRDAWFRCRRNHADGQHTRTTTLPRDSTIDTLLVTIRVITCVRYSLRASAEMHWWA